MKLWRFILLSVLLGYIFIPLPKVNAISSDVVIYQLQTGKTGGANEEFVLLFNSSPNDIDVRHWCLQYSSAKIIPTPENFNNIACITPPTQTELWLTSGGSVSFARAEFVSANPGFVPDFMLTGGSMAGTAGILRLINSANSEIDRLAWRNTSTTTDYAETLPATVHVSGQVLSRTPSPSIVDTDNNSVDFSSKVIASPIVSGLYEVEIPMDVCSNIDGLQEVVPTGFMQDDKGGCYEDVCENLAGLQISVPTGYGAELKQCALIPLETRTLFITELYPDAPSYDTGQEFIELYNPNNQAIDLEGYKIQVGPSYTQGYTLPGGVIAPVSYLTISDTVSGIVLPNSSGVSLRLVAPAGNIVSESAVYQNTSDNVSWALVDDIWIYTNQITPASANKSYLQATEDEEIGVTTVLAPCPAGKYRNPETNRCRNFETAVSQLTSCNEDEFRNPETNRCKKISSSSTTLKPCGVGEERNPETNRCRKVSVLGVNNEASLTEVKDVGVVNTSGQPNWILIATTLSLTGGYMLYEWRRELKQKLVFNRSN